MTCGVFTCLVLFGVLCTMTTSLSVSSLPYLNQLLIASMRGLCGPQPQSILSHFSRPVVQAISMSSDPTPAPTGPRAIPVTVAPQLGSVTGRTRVTVDDIALTLNAYNFILTAVKLEALIRTRPTLSTILLSFSSSADAVLDRFFDEVSKKDDSLRVILDVRKLQNLNSLIGAMDSRLVSIAELIQLSQIFDQNFMTVLRNENFAIFAKISSLLPDIEMLIVNLSGLIDSIPYTSSEEDLASTGGRKKEEIKYPRYGEVIGLVDPIVNQIGAGQAFLQQLPVMSSSYLSSHSKPNSLFTILNSF